ncbi:MAG TPA: HAD family hydrolase [Beijerinckiaceae bacterium]|nr:HAD family hydrolase [Beijerinckiaceae bacterium]
MTTAPTAVFDLDGTLADTAHDLVATLNVILGQEGIPPLPVAEAGDMISAGGRGLLQRGFEAARREPTPDLIEELYRRFLAYYGENLCIATRLYPGALAALDRLASEGFRLAICTNKMEAHSVKLLRALGVAGRFATICGRDTFPWFKPDPRHLTMTIERAGGDPRRAVMVGDSYSDVAAAKGAGIPVICVSFGYPDRPIREHGPDLVIDHFDELFGAVRSFVAADVAASAA